MPDTKLVVIYPYPTDVDKFERDYLEDHIPMAKEKIPGITKATITKFVATPTGDRPPYYRMAELYFDSVDDLKAAAGSQGGQEAVGHAISISSGGAPIFLIAEEETVEL
jgi:uncharacterized protein (TIGR02118 family)